MIQPCKCSGTSANVHPECLEHWLRVSGRTACEICKYKYEIQEMEEVVCVLCPPFRLGNDRSVRNMIIVLGFLCFFMLPSLALMTEEGLPGIFIMVNLLQCALVVCLLSSKMRPLETLLLWKVMSSMAFTLGAFMFVNYEYAQMEWVITACVGIITYLSLVRQVRKYNIMYIDNYISTPNP